MSDALTSAQRRKLKAIAQRLDASIKIGKNGLTDGFLKELDDALKRNELESAVRRVQGGKEGVSA